MIGTNNTITNSPSYAEVLPALFVICRVESSYSPSTKEPDRKRKELFSVVSDQPNHEKELNKVRNTTRSILPALMSLHKMAPSSPPSSSLLPAVFPPEAVIGQVVNSDTLCETSLQLFRHGRIQCGGVPL